MVLCLTVGCGSKSAEPPPPKPMDFGGLEALRPSDPASLAVFKKAFDKLKAEDDNNFNEVGALAFRLDTAPALTYIAENGSEKQARVAFSGLRAAIDGVASMGFIQSMGPDFKEDVYRKQLIETLKKPENKQRLEAGYAKLPPPGRATFASVMDALK